MIEEFINNFTLNSYYLNIIFIAVASLFVIAAAFFGLIRGLKKTTFRFAWLGITALVLFFVTPFITDLLFTKIDWSFIGVAIPGHTSYTAQQAINYYISTVPELSGLMSPNSILYELVSKLPYLILNVLIFLLAFWLLKIILWPLWAILSAIIIKKKNKKGEKIKKHRFWGMLVGCVMGIFIGSLTLMPITSLVNMAAKIETETSTLYHSEDEGVDGQGLIYRLLGKDITEFIVNFSAEGNSTNYYNYTGFGQLSSAIFAGLTTIEVEGKTITLEKDVINAVIIYDIVTSFANYDFNALDQEKLDTEILPAVKYLINAVFNSALIGIIFEGTAPFVVDNLLSDDPTFELPDLGSPEINQAFRDTLLDLKEYTFENLRADILKLVEIAETLNDANVIFGVQPILDDSTLTQEELIIELSELITGDIIREVIALVFEIRLIEIFTPLGVELYVFGLNQITEELDIFADPVLAGFETSIQNIISNLTELTDFEDFIIDLTYIYEDVLDAYLEYLEDETINYAKIGEIIDTIKTLSIFEGELNGLIYATLEYAEELLGQDILPVTNLFTALLEKDFEDIVWADELVVLGSLVDYALENMSDPDFMDNILTTTGANELGTVLNTLKTSELFGDLLNDFVADILVMITEEFDSEQLEQFEDLINDLEFNIRNASDDIDWKDELNNFILLMDLMEAGTDLEAIGGIIDDILDSNSQILTRDLIINAAKNLIDEFVGNSDPSIAAIVNDIKNSLDLVESFATELALVSEFMDYVMDLVENLGDGAEIKFAEFGEYLDSFAVDGSRESVLLSAISRTITETLFNTLIDSFDEVGDEDLIELLESVKENAMDALDDGATYTSIFTALQEILDEAQGLLELDEESFDLSVVAAKLDILANNILFGLENTQTIAEMMFDMLIDSQDDSTAQTILGNIKTNVLAAVEDGETYADVFEEVEDIIDEMLSLLELDEDEFDLTVVAGKLDALANNALFGLENTQIIAELMFDILIDSQDEVLAQTILGNIKTNVLEAVEDGETYVEVFAQVDDILDDMFALLDTDTSELDGTEIGGKLDGLASNELFGVENSRIIMNEIFDMLIEDETDVTVEDILTNLKANANLMITNGETFTDVFEQVEEVLNEVDDLMNSVDTLDQSNFDGAALGTSIENLENVEVFGLANAKIISNIIFDEVLEQLNEQLDAAESQPLLAAFIQTKIDNITALQNDMNSSSEVDFVEIFEEVGNEFTLVFGG